MIDDPFWAWAMIVGFFAILGSYVYIMIFSKSARNRRKVLAELEARGVEWQAGEDAPEPFPRRAERAAAKMRKAADHS